MKIKSILTRENVCYMVGQRFNNIGLPDLGNAIIKEIVYPECVRGLEDKVEPPWHEVLLEDSKVIRVYGVVETVMIQ